MAPLCSALAQSQVESCLYSRPGTVKGGAKDPRGYSPTTQSERGRLKPLPVRNGDRRNMASREELQGDMIGVPL